MTNKQFLLISTLVTAGVMAAQAVVTFINPAFAVAINESLTLVEGTAIAIMSKFVKEE